MSEDTKTNLTIGAIIAASIFTVFCGIALCIHVYGTHLASAEIQSSMRRPAAEAAK